MEVLKTIKDFFKLKDIGSVTIDNFVFRLHYKMTLFFLVVSAVTVTAKQFFGEPINCIGGGEKADKDALNSYCWIFGTYTIRNHYFGESGKHMAYPGVGPDNADEVIHHIYYQWVCIALLLQAMLFYIPHTLWKSWESGRLKRLTENLVNPIMPADWNEGRKDQLVHYFCDSNYLSHDMYAYKFAFCEALNLVNTISQIFLLDKLFGGQFRSYGAAVATFNYRPTVDAIDPMALLFPKVTKCEFFSYGHSGSIQRFDLLCILPLNIVNEKIFVFMWFWLFALSLLSGFALVYRALLFFCPYLRTCLIAGQVRCFPRWHLEMIIGNLRFGDWFLLHQLGVNINPIAFRHLVLAIGAELSPKTADL